MTSVNAGCLFAGIFGTGGGVTSYSENIGAIAITKVGSRQVITVAAIIMLVISFFVKLSALFATIPAPIIGGILAILCGIITAVGISIIKFVNLDNTRNLFIVGVSTFCGLSFPAWFKDHPEQIEFGGESINRFMTVLIRNPMFVTGVLAFVLDNTIQGASLADRGMTKWINLADDADHEEGSEPDLDRNNNNHSDTETVAATSEMDAATKRVYSLPHHCRIFERVGNWLPICMNK
jgi:xanthine/uracil permease